MGGAAGRLRRRGRLGLGGSCQSRRQNQHIQHEASPVYFRDRESGITTLYFNRFDGPGGDFLNPDQDFNIYVSTLGEDGTFGPGVLVRELNSPFRDTRMTGSR